MARKHKDFEVIEFKTQQEINADRRMKIENDRKALQRRIAEIHGRG